MMNRTARLMILALAAIGNALSVPAAFAQRGSARSAGRGGDPGAFVIPVDPNGSPLFESRKTTEGKIVLIKDGKTGPAVDMILAGSFRFSADHKRSAYAARHGGKEFIVLDGQPQPEYDSVYAPRDYRSWDQNPPIFSPDGSRFAYAASNFGYTYAETGHHYAVVDGVAGPAFDAGVGYLLFSPDSRRFAYAGFNVTPSDGRPGGGARPGSVVLDGKPGPPFARIFYCLFSPDSARFAYVAKQLPPGPSWTLVVLDGLAGPNFGDIGTPAFSPDSRHFVYPAKVGDQWHLVKDGELQETPRGLMTNLVFSPDSQHIAFMTSAGGRSRVFLDDQPGPEFDWIGSRGSGPALAFSQDGKHLTYRARNGAGNNAEWFTVSDGAVVRDLK